MATIKCAHDHPGHKEMVAQKLIQALSGVLSIIGSVLIIYIITRRGRCQLLRDRLLLGMSVFDVLSSVAQGLSVIPNPQITSCSTGIGNLTTCSIQGFFVQIGFAVPCYQAMLSVFYLLTIKYQMNPMIVAEKYELIMHAYAIIPCTITASIGAAKNYYFNEGGVCWIGDKCKSLGGCPDGNTFGQGLWLVLATTAFTALNTSITIISLIAIKLSLQKIDTAARRHAFHSMARTRQSRVAFMARESYNQALLYAGIYFVTYVWGALYIAATMANDRTKIMEQAWWHLLTGLFQPLMGFWNFLAFVRPMAVAIQRQSNTNSISFKNAVIMIIRGVDTRDIERRRDRTSMNMRNAQPSHITTAETEVSSSRTTDASIMVV